MCFSRGFTRSTSSARPCSECTSEVEAHFGMESSTKPWAGSPIISTPVSGRADAPSLTVWSERSLVGHATAEDLVAERLVHADHVVVGLGVPGVDRLDL